MDKKQVIAWLVPIVARGLAWALSVKLGYEAAQAQSLGLQAAEALGALVLVGISIYTSLKGRKKLLMQPPPSA